MSITVDLPPIPLTELLLALLVYLLFRSLELLQQGIVLLTEIRDTQRMTQAARRVTANSDGSGRTRGQLVPAKNQSPAPALLTRDRCRTWSNGCWASGRPILMRLMRSPSRLLLVMILHRLAFK